jgi:SP family general alpha glucoside:H+ symporter-like MFS transporter
MGVERETSPHRHEVVTKKDSVDDAALAEAIAFEHNLTLGQALKLYPAAIAWSGFVSIGVIMLAFDPQLLGNLYATPQFQSDFGYMYEGEVNAPFSGDCVTRVVG